MTLTEFKNRFNRLSKKDFVPTQCCGPTGLHKTLEYELKLTENRIALSRNSFADLKTIHYKSTNMMTLFEFSNELWHLNHIDALRIYGSCDGKGKGRIYTQLNDAPDWRGLYILFEADSIELRHKDGTIIASINQDELINNLREIHPALILVTADSQGNGPWESFHFYLAQILSKVWKGSLGSLLSSRKLLFEVRLHERVSHGLRSRTGILIQERCIRELFGRVEGL
jgi:hypothetical protein